MNFVTKLWVLLQYYEFFYKIVNFVIKLWILLTIDDFPHFPFIFFYSKVYCGSNSFCHNTFAIFQKFKIFWPKMTIFFVINNTSVLSFENGNWQGTSRLAFDRSSEWLPELNVRFVSPFYRLHNKNFVWVVWNTRPFVAMKKRRFEIISHGQLKFEVWTWPYGSTYAF